MDKYLRDDESIAECFRRHIGEAKKEESDGTDYSHLKDVIRNMDMACLELANEDRLCFLQSRLEQLVSFYDYFFESNKDDPRITREMSAWSGTEPFMFETARTGLSELIALGISRQELTDEEISGTNLESLMQYVYDIPNPRVYRIYLGGMSMPAIKYSFLGREAEKALKLGRENIIKLLSAGKDNEGYLVADIYKEGRVERYMFRCTDRGVDTVSKFLVPEYLNDSELNVVPCEFYPE